MKKYIVTIETRYSIEEYFMPLDLSKSEICQVDKMLAEIGFCEDYDLVRWEEVSEEYKVEREKLVKQWDEKYAECIEHRPLTGKYATLEALRFELR